MMRLSQLLIVLACAFHWTNGPAAGAGDLVDAIQAAIDTHPRLQLERANLRAARETLPLALAPYRPQLSFQASTANSDREAVLSSGQIINDETSPSTYTLDARQVIWSGGQRGIAHRRAILSVRSAQARFAAAEEAIVLEVTTAYLDLLLANETLLIETENLRGLSRQLDGANAQLERGAATRTDVAQAEARLAEVQARLAVTRANLTMAHARFERMTGYRATVLEWTPVELPWTQLIDIQELAAEFNHDLASARLDAEIARLDLSAAARRNNATVTLGVQRSQSDNVSPAVVSDDDTQVNLTLNIPLLSGGENAARRRQAVAARSAARFAVQDMEAEVNLLAIQEWARKESAEYSLEAQRERVAAAAIALEGVERGHEAGLWTLVDVLDTTEQLHRARISFAEAQRELRLGQTRLAIMTGSLEY